MALEVGHKGLTKLHVVHSMHECKALMADLSDAFRSDAGRIRDAGGVLRGGYLDATWSPCQALRNPECAGVKFQIEPGAGRSDRGCCQEQNWSQFWSQNSMVDGVSVLPMLLVKSNGREKPNLGNAVITNNKRGLGR
jgi:hypothetical protein